MTCNELPRFVVKQNLQKTSATGERFSDAVTPEVLREVCRLITGSCECSVEYVGNAYSDGCLPATFNKGRLAIMYLRDEAIYVSFSERVPGGRNSSVQSVPTAFNMYYAYPGPKRLYYYFLNTTSLAATDYHLMIYRLMSTIGFRFLNAPKSAAGRISPFVSADDIIYNRRANAGRNRGNNSTFITRGGSGELEVYGKTYGANKYETSLICYALAALSGGRRIRLFEVLEGNLRELPEASLDVMRSMGVIDIEPTDMTLEKRIFETQNSLRSPRFTLNLYKRLGNKRCALCNCEIPELVQAAHIWPVAAIKRSPAPEELRLKYAVDGNNGIWLCENHHRLFDEGLMGFDDEGNVVFSPDAGERTAASMRDMTPVRRLPEEYMSEGFRRYLSLRRGYEREQA